MNAEYIAAERERLAKERLELEDLHAKGRLTWHELSQEVERMERMLARLAERAVEMLKKIEDVVTDYC